MARNRIKPSYRFHKSTGRGIVTYYQANGGRRSVLLPGPFNSDQSVKEYRRILAILDAGGAPRITSRQLHESPLSIAELIERYWHHVNEYYRRADGTQTQEVATMMYSLRPLNFLHGDTYVRDFGPSALKAVRQLMIDGYTHPKFDFQRALARTQINARVKRIRRMFKWGVENELVPAETLFGLQAVAPLKRGRTKAHEAEAVKPIARAIAEKTLSILRPMLQAMVMLQLETGMRPGELVALCPTDIDIVPFPEMPAVLAA
jgi:hypothetical protein